VEHIVDAQGKGKGLQLAIEQLIKLMEAKK